jgi:nitroreductase
MDWLKKKTQFITIWQWILIALGVGAGVGAVILGISDNPPGIILVYAAIVFWTGAWVWNWRSPREFWTLLGLAILSFPVGVVLHNLLYALGTVITKIPVLPGLVGFLEGFFFIVAVLVVGPVAVVALIGGIYTSWLGMGGLVKSNRSTRRFVESRRISEKELKILVNLARLSASGSNRQPLKFILSWENEKNEVIFPTLSWAGYLKEWAGPEEGERPAAYIILLGDTELAKSFQYDAGIACQSITLGAAEMGLGCCLIGSIKKDTLRKELSIPDRYEILLVIAMGKPGEKVVVEKLPEDGDIKYWRDEYDIHHVPKRKLVDLVLDL